MLGRHDFVSLDDLRQLVRQVVLRPAQAMHALPQGCDLCQAVRALLALMISASLCVRSSSALLRPPMYCHRTMLLRLTLLKPVFSAPACAEHQIIPGPATPRTTCHLSHLSSGA